MCCLRSCLLFQPPEPPILGDREKRRGATPLCTPHAPSFLRKQESMLILGGPRFVVAGESALTSNNPLCGCRDRLHHRFQPPEPPLLGEEEETWGHPRPRQRSALHHDESQEAAHCMRPGHPQTLVQGPSPICTSPHSTHIRRFPEAAR